MLKLVSKIRILVFPSWIILSVTDVMFERDRYFKFEDGILLWDIIVCFLSLR